MKMWHYRCKEMFTRLSYNDVRIRLIVIDDLIISRAYDPGKDNSVMIIEKNTAPEDQQMNIHVIIQVKKKIQEFDVIQFYLNHLQFSNVSTDTTVILKEKMLNEKST